MQLGNTATGSSELVDEIVQRVLLRLQDSQMRSVAQSTTYPGRLLTMSILENLSLANALHVDRRCVVTPEVKDELKRRGIELVKVVEGTGEVTRVSERRLLNDENREKPIRIQVWQERDSRDLIKSLGGETNSSSVSFSQRDFSCVEKLAQEVSAAMGRDRGLHLIVCQRPLMAQRFLNRQSLFAPVADLGSSDSLAEILEASTRIVIVRAPVMRWSMKRLLRGWIAKAQGEFRT